MFAICGNGSENLGEIVLGEPTDSQLGAKPGYGHSVLKLRLDRTAGQLNLVDWFTP